MTFGYKIAAWIDGLIRVLSRIDTTLNSLTGQFAGAVGTLAALVGNGFETRDRLCAELELNAAEIPWHTSRDRIRDIVNTLCRHGQLNRLQSRKCSRSPPASARIYVISQKGWWRDRRT